MTTAAFACRPGCAACCIAPSITSFIPGMAEGKPAGVRCIQLSRDGYCLLFNQPERPAFCASLMPNHDMCGDTTEQALRFLGAMEIATRPDFQA
jgi:Fe-S-cluster containining protein